MLVGFDWQKAQAPGWQIQGAETRSGDSKTNAHFPCSDDGTLDCEVREQIRELCERHTGRLDAQLKEKLAVSSGKLRVSTYSI